MDYYQRAAMSDEIRKIVKMAWTRDDSFGRMVYDVFTNDRTDSENGTIAPPADEK